MATRDINAERQALGKYNEIYGGNPDFKDQKQKAQLYALAYPKELPTEASDLDMNTYNSLTGKGNTANTGGASLGATSPAAPININTNAAGGSDVNAQNAQQYMDASQKQYNDMGGLSGANSMMGKLQDIIAKKENIYNPNIGTSDIFNSAGLTGIGSLSSSLSANKSQLQAVGRDMDYALSRAQGAMQTQLNESKMNWDKGTYFYDLAAKADEQARTAMVNSVVDAIKNGDPVDDSVFGLLPKEYQQFVPAWKALATASRTRTQEKTKEQTALNGLSSPTDIYSPTPKLNTSTSTGYDPIKSWYANPKYSGSSVSSKYGVASSADFANLSTDKQTQYINDLSKFESGGDANNKWVSGNNNPLAFTYEALKNTNLVEGTDYVKGDLIKSNGMHGAKLLGNGLEQTRKALLSGTSTNTINSGSNGGYNGNTGGQWYGEGITAVQTAAGKDIKPYVINDYLNSNGGDIPDAIKHFSNLGNTPEYTGDLRNVVDGIASKTKDDTFQNTINQFITRNGTDDNAVAGLRTLILNKGLEAVQATNPNAANNIVNDKQAYDLLAQIQKLQTGTNPISGNITKLLMATGLSGNDAINNAAKLNTFIQQAKERYVVAQQGKGTGANTQKAYDAMFPDLSKTTKLNKETINAMIDAMNTTVKQDYITGMGINEQQWNNVFEKNPFQQNQNNTVILKDPKTGKSKSFTNLSKADLEDALKQGFIKQ